MNNDDLNTTEEQALDALLAEIHSELHGNAGPPDLSATILAKMADGLNVVVDVKSAGSGIHARRARKSSGGKVVAVLSIVATLAASVLLVVWLGGRNDSPVDETPKVAVNENLDAPVDSIVENDVAVKTTDLPRPDVETPRRIPKGIPLVVGNGGNGGSTSPTDLNGAIEVAPSGPTSQAITLVSKHVDNQLRAYWDAIGMQPTDETSADALAARLSVLLGVKISTESLEDAAALQSKLAQADVARVVANRWLDQVTEGGIGRVDAEARQRLIEEITNSFQSKQRLDVTLANLMGGTSPLTSDWYSAMTASGRESFVHRLASLSMNVDLRCTRCHDAMIEGSGRQEDYWSFAAFFSQRVQRAGDGEWSVDQKESAEPVFYELPDGRQRMVQGAVPSAWLSVDADRPIESVRQWSQQIVGSPELARGVVNSLWKLVHSRPLRGGVVDTLSAPHHETLKQMEDRLVDDLLESNFDVARTLALVIHSPASRRSVPPPLQADNALLASEDQLRAARDVVNAFAGALPNRSRSSIKSRVDLAMRSVGDSVQSIRNANTINAQTNGEPSRDNPREVNRKDQADTGFPTKVADLPVQWLASVKGYENRVDHLGYLAGVAKVPSEVRDLAGAMKKSDEIGEELALHRVWWLLSP